MKTISKATIAAILLASGVTLAKEPHPIHIQTIFVEGNSESADKLREKMEKWSCLKLVSKRDEADAIMNVEEREKPSDLHKVATSVTLVKQDGEQIWYGTKTGEGVIGSGAGMAAENLLHDLSKDACPPHWCGTPHCTHLR